MFDAFDRPSFGGLVEVSGGSGGEVGIREQQITV